MHSIAEDRKPTIIEMHLHALPVDFQEPSAANDLCAVPGVPAAGPGYALSGTVFEGRRSGPETVGVAVESVRSADFLSEAQKRDILYNNAARFLRLFDEQIDEHHSQ